MNAHDPATTDRRGAHPAALHKSLARAKLQASLLESIEGLDDAAAWVRAAALDSDLLNAVDEARVAALRAFRLIDPDTTL